MSRNTMLKILNPILGLLVANQAITAMLHDVLPHEFFELHEIGGPLLVIVALTHLILNWGWVKANFLKRKPAEKS